jgi:hypothetical protein
MESEFNNGNISRQDGDGNQIRPKFLTVLCILSFIGGITQGFSNLMMGMMFPMIREMMNNEDVVSLLPEVYMESMDQIFAVDRIFYFVTGILYIASFMGVLYMWKLKKVGFHIYAIAQILILTASSIFVYPNQEVSSFYFDLLFALIFIYLYYGFYKRNMQ